MKIATLVYVRNAGQTLMLHRVKKAQDIHEGKWNGLGGKLEPGESPEECAVREVFEESGLTIEAPEWRGILTFPNFAKGEDWYAFVYVARHFRGSLIDSPEGRLAWIPDATIASLPLWPGDRVFLPWLDDGRFFSATFRYAEGALVNWFATFYGEGGIALGTTSGQGADLPVIHPAAEALMEFAPTELSASSVHAVPRPGLGATAAGAPYRYSAAEDGYCWVCGAPVEKRHCKISCSTCGFMRDCSDP
jgi:8-oxo-dGTP diphosphatase